MSVRTVEYRPTRSLHPSEYASVAQVFEAFGYAPSGMIEHESRDDGAPVYFFFGESNAEMIEEAFDIRNRIMARIMGYFSVKITDVEQFAEGWLRPKASQVST